MSIATSGSHAALRKTAVVWLVATGLLSIWQLGLALSMTGGGSIHILLGAVSVLLAWFWIRMIRLRRRGL